MEHITHEPGNSEAWVCVCGNTPSDDGFYPCNLDGAEREPVLDSDWDGVHYGCAGCKRIINLETLAVEGSGFKPTE